MEPESRRNCLANRQKALLAGGQGEMLKIYIASSFRNKHFVQLLTSVLVQLHWCEVLDWTEKSPPFNKNLPVEVLRQLFDLDDHGNIFKFCTEACKHADLVIYIGPSGQDAAAEIAIAYASGVPVLGLASPLEKPGLILNGVVTHWCDSFEELLDQVEVYAQQKFDRGQ